jgi:aminopeptidase N
LNIQKVTTAGDKELKFEIGDEKKHLGNPLRIRLDGADKIRIYYSTSKNAAALQWLNPQQTADKKFPFLFTQSQAILARTWIPCQDGPGVRYTYEAKVAVPKDLMAVMSAENPVEKNSTGVYEFKQDKPVPSYLMALSVGDFEFRSLGSKTGVYAEHSMIDKCAYEFADMQKMLNAAEKIYGKYRWGRYDVIVLPPSFPFGGMENPELTFATPTIIAGDRSLVSLVAHELAHSWSGNLVTNATWNDFWLNEGFTVYFERRIMEAVEGKPYADMLQLLGFQELQNTVEELGATHPDTHLKLELKDRDPDEGLSDIAYEKGNALLRTIENTVGRVAFDKFINNYFSDNAFKTMTTEKFIEYFNRELVKGDKKIADAIQIEKWIYGPGIPENCPVFTSERFDRVNTVSKEYAAGKPAQSLNTRGWSSHEWLQFIRHLPEDMNTAQMKELDHAFHFSSSGNNEILGAWFPHVIEHNYSDAYTALENFLVHVGRRKFLTPLYKRLIETPDGKEMALNIYRKARPNYHFVATQTMDELLGWKN